MTTTASWSDALVQQIADSVVERINQHVATDRSLGGEKLTYDEGEAAELLGVPRHVLKGCRERGEIKGRKIGKKWHYTRQELVRFANAD